MQHVTRDSSMEYGVRPLSDFAKGSGKDAPTAAEMSRSISFTKLFLDSAGDMRDRPKVKHPQTGEWHFEHRGKYGSWPKG